MAKNSINLPLKKASKDKSKSKSFFNRLFSIISGITSILIILTTLSLTYIFNNFTKELSKDSNHQNLLQVNYHFNYMHDFIQSFMQNIYNNPSTSTLLYSKEDNILELKKKIDLLDKYRDNSIFIHSYYFYNAKDSYFICIGEANVIRDTIHMFDKDILKALNELKPYSPIQPIARFIPSSAYTTDIKDKVYSYIIGTFNNRTDDLENAIIVNIDANWVLDNINTITHENRSDNDIFMFLDESGNVLGHTDDSFFSKNLKDRSYITEILTNAKDSNFFQRTIDNIDYYINTYKNNDLNITFLYFTPKQLYTSYFNDVLKFIFIIICGILIITIFVSYIMSNIFYAPIKLLKTEIQGFYPNIFKMNQKTDNDILMLNKALKNLKTDINTLENFKTDNIEYLREHFLASLILSKNDINSELLSDLNRFQISIDINKPLLIFILEVDHCLTSSSNMPFLFSDSNKELITREINSILSKYLYIETIVVDGNYVSISSIKDTSYTDYDFIKEIEPSIKLLQKRVKSLVGNTITVTISNYSSSLETLPDIYDKTLELSDYRLVYGHESIILPSMENQSTVEPFQLPLKELMNLSTTINIRDLSRSKEIIKSLLLYLSRYSVDDIKFGISYISFTIIHSLNTIISNMHIELTDDFNSLNDQIANIETLKEVEIYYCTFLSDIFSRISEPDINRYEKVIHEVEKIVSNSYTDKNLSPYYIADHVKLSAKYLNTIFKKYTGTSISQYVNDYRLTVACRLLTETQLSIEEIIDQIGWGNSKYFFSCFKKEFGVTPTLFRKSQ